MGQSILTSDQHQLLAVILKSPIITDQFYLTGGTALAEYYFQHRLSEDFDFFTETEFDEHQILSWVKKTAQQLKIENIDFKTLNGQLQFFFHFDKSIVKLDIAYYPFDHLGEFKKQKSMKISSLLDITVNKIQALQTRKRGRDFFDLFIIFTESDVTIQQAIENYRNKFGMAISKQEVAKQFAQVTSATDQPHFLGNVDWKKIEQFFLDHAKELSQIDIVD